MAVVPTPAESDLAGMIGEHLDDLVADYKFLHAHPEVSYQEKETAAFVAERLKELGFQVTENFGDYGVSGRNSYGVIGVFENGDGPTVLVRTDLDALPVEEKTGLPYASEVRLRTKSGVDTGVMHACGHDVHMTVFLGTAWALSRLTDQWNGKLVMIGQPAEERGAGAKALINGGLFSRFGRPDYALALHVNESLLAGTVGLRSGYALASVDSVDIRIRGVGGHGAYPHKTKDPVVLAAQTVVALQTIVSREVSPLDSAVVTVGSIHGGTKHNIIGDQVDLQLTVRSYRPEVRQEVLESIRRIVTGTAIAAGIPDELMPTVGISENENTPATYNDPNLTRLLSEVFRRELGEDRVKEVAPVMAGEDFSRYGMEGIPSVIFWLGTVDPQKKMEFESAGKTLPALHSSEFAPQPGRTILTGVNAMVAAVLNLMIN
jgi:hippurate hydrolase